MDIDKLEAGPELNSLVIEKIMRWRVVNKEYSTVDKGSGFFEEFCPSTDIEAAMEVLEKMRTWKGKGSLGCRACIEIHSLDDSWEEGENKPYLATIWGKEGIAEILPLAICRAALKAVLENV